jgi:hypothetical protein
MEETLGEKLVRRGFVTPKQVEQALMRQKLHGGRLGQNLISLNFITKEKLQEFFQYKPPMPKTIEQTGLSMEFLSELTLKIMLYLGNFNMYNISERLKLPVSIVDQVIQSLRQEKFCEVKGGSSYQSFTYSFTITASGRQRASELLETSRYVGPAPVTLEAYTAMFEYQTIKNIFVSEESVRQAFAPYVISEQLLDQLGPAVNSGKSIFLYGPPGNGKTVIAETIGSLMGEKIYIPYAICVDREIINVYDPISHVADPERPPIVVEESGFTDISNEFDQRWLHCKRPVVLVGGELTLGMLDLDFNTVSKYYEAPVQVKANGGVFIIDDFGRQMVRPRDLLNRWIVPLERRTDFLTLHTGKKFEVPFDELVIFSTNIEPRELVDEAFLRRIRYKVQITHPPRDEYIEIFRRICESNGLEYREDIVKYLLNQHYDRTGIKMNACHPRDIIDQILDISRYKEEAPRLEREIIDEAWNNYFVEI